MSNKNKNKSKRKGSPLLQHSQSKKPKLSSKQLNTISNLPQELIEMIGEFIPPTEISTFLSLSKSFSIS